MENPWRRTLKLALDCGICFSLNQHTSNATFAEATLKFGATKTKQLAPVAELNGNAQTKQLHV